MTTSATPTTTPDATPSTTRPTHAAGALDALAARADVGGMSAARDAFVERIMRSAAGVFEIFTIHIGDQLGPYDALALDGPSTAAALAARTGTHERYVREWLEQQTVAGILGVEDARVPAEARRFFVPAAHVEVLIDQESLSFVPPLAQSLAGAVRPLRFVLDRARSVRASYHAVRARGRLARSHARLTRLHAMGTQPRIDVAPVSLDAILDMREEYRREMGCQIVHDSWHARGFTSSYLLRVRGDVVGYGAVGGAPRDAKDTLKEFYVRPPHRGDALPLFRRLVAESGARTVEAQTNDVLLSLMLHDCATGITSETILFADGAATTLDPPASGAVVRRLSEADRERAFVHTLEPVGEWGLESDGELVATGGLAFHYNPPYGDIYMEVAEPHRRRGFGSYLVQELKRQCRAMGCIPAARCHHDNVRSRLTLQRAGMFPCARILHARLER